MIRDTQYILVYLTPVILHKTENAMHRKRLSDGPEPRWPVWI